MAVRRNLVFLAIASLVAALVSWPSAALAGGPTSVLLASPRHETTASLYVSEPRYRQLDTLLHEGLGAGRSGPLTFSESVNVTWLAHDVNVWRIDRIALDVEDGPWVASAEMGADGQAPVMSPGSSGEPSDFVWRKVAKPGQLMNLLNALGVLDSARPARAVPPVAEPTTAAPAPAAKRAADTAITTGLWWAAPGLLAGLLIAAGGMRFRRRPVEPSARAREQELLDRAY